MVLGLFVNLSLVDVVFYFLYFFRDTQVLPPHATSENRDYFGAMSMVFTGLYSMTLPRLQFP